MCLGLDQVRIFIYRRTHIGDPCGCGIFGVHDCMGRCRAWDYDAVVGVGVDRPRRNSRGIAGRLTWVGIEPRKHPCPGARGPQITFKHFCLMNEDGPLIEDCAPGLAEHMARVRMSDSLPPDIQSEVDQLVKRYRKHPRSQFTQCQCQGTSPRRPRAKRCKSSC